MQANLNSEETTAVQDEVHLGSDDLFQEEAFHPHYRVLYPRRSVEKLKEGFTYHPLTTEQRAKLGVAQYYRPYHVDRDRTVKRRHTYWAVKRLFDIVCSSIALIVLSPLILLVMLVIYIEDPHGSPIYKQTRVGKMGKTFTFLKLRSMYCGADKQLKDLLKDNEFDGKAFKIKDDPRITKVGKIIRNTSIDELMQLVNIVKGDMSIVGPRPPLPREYKLYDDYEKQKMTCTPGLTCFWQVYPERHEISFDDWIALDIKYIAERSWRVDIQLIFKTVSTVLKHHAD